MKKNVLSIILILTLCLGLLPATALAVESTSSEDIVIFYTNDVHTYVDNNVDDENGLTYSRVAALKASHENSLLVDAGDHIQGTAYGQMDNGKTIIELMNAADYDLATLGNHEFDYGMSGCLQAIEWAEFDYVSCNFHHEKNGVAGDSVLDSYKIFEVDGTKIAFIGITTPESFSKSSPAYFQDGEGNYIYGIAGGTDGEALYASVQSAVDAAEEGGAEYIIALGHLGDDASSAPWRSEDVISNTTGIDAFIDGHSHSTVPMKEVPSEDGHTVILTQTGSYLDAVGKLTISTGDDTITTALLYGDDLAELAPDPDVKEIEDRWITEVNDQLGEIIGFSEVTFDNYDSEGNRLVRKQSTNTGDFVADALYYLFDEMDMDVDVAIMNGGGIRNNAITGEISYLTCKEIHPFGNVACLLTVTGQQLLDALEWGSKDLNADGSAESGSLLHTSGLKYTLDLSYASTVQGDEKGVWTGAPTGEYRVKDVQVLNKEIGEYEPLELDAEYNLAGYNYTLRDLGGGFAMFNGAVNVLDYVAEDYMVLANYIEAFPVDEATGLPTITTEAGYSELYGSGRITVVTSPKHADVCPSRAFTDLNTGAWYHSAVDHALENGLMNGVGESLFKPDATMSRAMLVTVLWRLEGSPVVDYLMAFEDVPYDNWYTEAVRWASSEGIIEGYDGSFAPEAPVTREQSATILWRYAKYKGYDVCEGEDTNILSYEDAFYISEYAISAMQWACGAGLVEGDGVRLTPAASATRAQAAALLMRFCKLDK